MAQRSRIIHLNVGGTRYSTSTSTIMRYPDSMLAVMIEQENEQRSIQEGKELFIDRNGSIFKYILEYYRNGEKMVLPENGEILRELMLEVEFFQLPGLKHLVVADPNQHSVRKFKIGDYVLMNVPIPDNILEMESYSYNRTKYQAIEGMQIPCEHSHSDDFKHFLESEFRYTSEWIGKILNVKQSCAIVKFIPRTRRKNDDRRDDRYIFHMPQPFLKTA